MAILKIMKDKMTKEEMLSHSKGNSPKTINEIIMPTGEIIDVDRKRGVRIDQASELAANFFDEWSKDGLLARSSKKDTEAEFYPNLRNRKGRADEWEHGAFTMTEAEGQAWDSMSDEDKARFMEIIRETVRTDPSNPAAKRAVAFSDMHTNTKNKHVHFYAHAHLIDYGTGDRPSISGTVINNNSFANTVNDALRFNLVESGFDFIQLREQPMIGQSVEASPVDLNEAGNIPSAERVNVARDMSPQTMAIEKLLEESNKRMAEEAERQALLMNALSFSTQNAELEKEIGKLNKEAELKDEKIQELETSLEAKLEAAKTELLTKFETEMEELKKSHSEELTKINDDNAEVVKTLQFEKDALGKQADKFYDELQEVEPTIKEANERATAAEERATRAEELVTTLQTTIASIQDTIKQTYTSQIDDLKAKVKTATNKIKKQKESLDEYRQGKLMDMLEAKFEGKNDQQQAAMLDQMTKFFKQKDAELEARNTASVDETQKPRQP